MVRESKRCPGCDTTKPSSEFYRSQNRYDGLTSKCKVCTKKDVQTRYNRVRPVLPEGHAFCPRCKHVLALDGFDLNDARPNGRQVYCKTCWPEYMRYWRRTGRGGFVETEKAKAIRATPGGRWKYEARLLTKLAVKFGYFTRQPCEVCGDPDVQVHHTQYDKPLDGLHWYCKKHHLEVGHGGRWDRGGAGQRRKPKDEGSIP